MSPDAEYADDAKDACSIVTVFPFGPIAPRHPSEPIDAFAATVWNHVDMFFAVIPFIVKE